MKIAFIHNPYYFQDYMENLPFVANNFAVLPPMGILYASSLLKNEGHQTKVIDIKANKLSRPKVIKKLKEFSPDLVGVMVIPYTARISLDWAKHIKEELDVPIVAGNYAMVRYSEAVVSNDFIDYGIKGTARGSLTKLVDYLEGQRNQKEDIPGLVYKDDKNNIIVNEPECITEDLDKLPWPDRDVIDNSKYYTMASKKRPMTLLITSYGCIFDCNFCDMGKFGFSERDPIDVVDEMEYCINEYNIKEFDIFDRDFLIKKERAKKICKEIISRDLDVTWYCRARVDLVDRETLNLMKEAGCRLILFGIESGDNDVLDRIHKNVKVDEIKDSIQLTKDFGIETLGFFIIGHPDESIDEIEKTLELATELPLDYAQFFKMSGKPGAKLYEEITDELGYDYFEELIRGNTEVRDLPRPWVDLSNKELEYWAFQGYKKFYLRPSYIYRRLKTLNSLAELFKNIKVATKMFKKYLKGLNAKK